MKSTHTMLATIPVGDPDIGAEVEVNITFAFYPLSPAIKYGRRMEPYRPAHVEFVSAEPYCNGKPSPFYGAFADLEQQSLDELASDWLDENEADALDKAYSDIFAAEDARDEARNNGQLGVGA